MKKPILVFHIILNLVLKTLRLEAPTVCWSNLFHLLITLLEKSASNNHGCNRPLVKASYDWYSENRRANFFSLYQM